MAKVIASVTIVPLGTATPSLSSYVAGVEKVLAKYTNLKTQLTPMATIIEGELDEILSAVREMHETPFKNGALRVSTRIGIDDRRDKETSMERKVKVVKDLLAK